MTDNQNERQTADDEPEGDTSDESERELIEKTEEIPEDTRLSDTVRDDGHEITADDEETVDKPTETDDGPAEGNLARTGDEDDSDEGLTQTGEKDDSDGGVALSGDEDEVEREPVVTDEGIDETGESVPNPPAQTASAGSEQSEDSLFADDGEPDSKPVPARDPVEDAFEEVAVEDVEADEIWAEVTEEERTELADEIWAEVAGEERTELADEIWAEVAGEERTELPGETAEDETSETEPVPSRVDEVSKHDYCESCEYFSEAPEIRCTHEGTEILEFVDMDNVRVSNCPIVAERKRLEEGISQGNRDVGDIQRD